MFAGFQLISLEPDCKINAVYEYKLHIIAPFWTFCAPCSWSHKIKFQDAFCKRTMNLHCTVTHYLWESWRRDLIAGKMVVVFIRKILLAICWNPWKISRTIFFEFMNKSGISSLWEALQRMHRGKEHLRDLKSFGVTFIFLFRWLLRGCSIYRS